MARAVTNQRKSINTLIAWAIGFLIFFPILWTILTSFKTEAEAIASPPSFLFFHWNLDAYHEVQERSNYFLHFWNSVVISLGSTLVGLAIAIPAAWSMAFVPAKRTKDVLMWMLSTKMLPPVGVLIPIYLIFRDTGLLDTRIGLVIVMTLINLPIIIWMLFTYFREIPGEILEAARMDGATLRDVDLGADHGLILCVFGEINVFRPADAGAILRRAGQVLSDDGVLLLEPHTFQGVQQQGESGSSFSTHPSGLFGDAPYMQLSESFWDSSSCTATTRWWIVDAGSGHVTLHAQTMQAYSDSGYTELLRAAGFEDITQYASLEGDEAGVQQGLFALAATRRLS